MTVYVVMMGWDFEGEQLDTVWASREAAERRARTLLLPDDVTVVEVAVDEAPPAKGWLWSMVTREVTHDHEHR